MGNSKVLTTREVFNAWEENFENLPFVDKSTVDGLLNGEEYVEVNVAGIYAGAFLSNDRFETPSWRIIEGVESMINNLLVTETIDDDYTFTMEGGTYYFIRRWDEKTIDVVKIKACDFMISEDLVFYEPMQLDIDDIPVGVARKFDLL